MATSIATAIRRPARRVPYAIGRTPDRFGIWAGEDMGRSFRRRSPIASTMRRPVDEEIRSRRSVGGGAILDWAEPARGDRSAARDEA
jgi:hypothetical protein